MVTVIDSARVKDTDWAMGMETAKARVSVAGRVVSRGR
jgi:hypothetical protein